MRQYKDGKPVIFVNLGKKQGIVICKAATNLIFQIQAGGVACNQKYCEGFIMGLSSLGENKDTFSKALNKFDDCSKGCWDYEDGDLNYKESYGHSINAFLEENVNPYSIKEVSCKFSFDFDRKIEVTEGWWPVNIEWRTDNLVWGCYGEDYSSDYYTDIYKGYLHFGNCD